jgi:hypothetical protein
MIYPDAPQMLKKQHSSHDMMDSRSNKLVRDKDGDKDTNDHRINLFERESIISCDECCFFNICGASGYIIGINILVEISSSILAIS